MASQLMNTYKRQMNGMNRVCYMIVNGQKGPSELEVQRGGGVAQACRIGHKIELIEVQEIK